MGYYLESTLFLSKKYRGISLPVKGEDPPFLGGICCSAPLFHLLTEELQLRSEGELLCAIDREEKKWEGWLEMGSGTQLSPSLALLAHFLPPKWSSAA